MIIIIKYDTSLSPDTSPIPFSDALESVSAIDRIFTFLNPLRIGNFVYGTSGQGATAIMTATEIATGETAWRARGYSRASMIHVDGKVLLLEEDGDLTLATVTPANMTTLATMQLFNTRAWTVPTLVGTTLYARDREKIVALDLSK